jgi:hypothetical protein
MGKLIMLTYRREETPSKIQLPTSLHRILGKYVGLGAQP